ncbi:MAG: hypothetical protein U0350_34690 [Caldilineaceae bacterium]
MLLMRIPVFLVGLIIIWHTIESAVVTFVLPRNSRHWITTTLFLIVRRFFDFRTRRMRTYLERDRIMALYAPVSLLLLVPAWMALLMIGFACLYWATGMNGIDRDFLLSGSSLLTLGFAASDTPFQTLLVFSEALSGLILIALLISYLPTMYSAFSRREVAVSQLAVRAGTPPSAVEFIVRTSRIGGLHNMHDFWVQWETWFAEVAESHTSLAALVFFRSPDPQQSWITAAGAVLDTAALLTAAVDVPRMAQRELCIRSGYLCLRRIADFFGVQYNPMPRFPVEPISITRAEFDAVCQQLTEREVPLKADLDKAWQDYAGWRVNYDKVLLALCSLTMAPDAPWSTDHAPPYKPIPLFRKQ